MAAGCRMAIAPGKPMNPLTVLEAGGRCTWFLPAAEPRTARKRWIAGSVQTRGILLVDEGAVAALKSGKSLLPPGVAEVSGDFERGDAVEVRTKDGQVVGKGLSAYAAFFALAKPFTVSVAAETFASVACLAALANVS